MEIPTESKTVTNRMRREDTMTTRSALWALTAITVLPCGLDAQVTRIEIIRAESPTFEGRVFGDVGQYEKLVGVAFGEVAPTDRRNALITDIDLAPRNDRGRVEYETDIYILRPVDTASGNGRLIYGVPNRGGKPALRRFNNSPSTNDPTAAADAGDGFLMHQGYTIVWSGWESGSVTSGDDRLTAQFPVATNPDGSSITGPHIDEFVFNDLETTTATLNHAAASTDQALARLRVRQAEADPQTLVPVSEWSFLNERQININRFDAFLSDFDGGAIYELFYTAKDPIVMGLGFAATRDIVSFLRYDRSDANPLSQDIRAALAFGQSQSGRYLKDFLRLGFNEDLAGRIVFEGLNVHVAGARGMILNDRFATPGWISWQHQNHHARNTQFPFTYGMLTDPISGRTDGLLRRCLETDTCPKVFHTDSANEYWGAAASLIHTDSYGNDLTLPANVRFYLFSSTQHVPATVPRTGICQQLSNPNPYRPNLRALLLALDAWSSEGVEPPPSRHPRVSDGTLVSPLPRAAQGFPAIPDVAYSGLINHVTLLDFRSLPAVHVPGTDYTVLVPKVDTDGNDIAGIRSTALEVPVGTYTGWNLRRAGFAEGEHCGLAGSFIPFAATEDDRRGSGDPRPSIAERYPNHGDYVSRVAEAARQLQNQRFMLQEDVDRIIELAEREGPGR